jgi:hypothetical protein
MITNICAFFHKVWQIIQKLYLFFELHIDFFVSLIFTIITYFFSPSTFSNSLGKDIYGIGINILAIVFSVYFAALAIIISSGNDDFILFLEDIDESYTTLIKGFQVTLKILLLSLMYSLIAYIITVVSIDMGKTQQNNILFILFIFASMYSLTATFFASNDVIQYAIRRSKFLKISHNQNTSRSSNKNSENQQQN